MFFGNRMVWLRQRGVDMAKRHHLQIDNLFRRHRIVQTVSVRRKTCSGNQLLATTCHIGRFTGSQRAQIIVVVNRQRSRSTKLANGGALFDGSACRRAGKATR